jgi:lysophospholipase L1-like esterase
MRSTLGGRALRLVISVLTAVGLGGLGPPAASASSAPVPVPSTYLALGDSVPFGFQANLPSAIYTTPRLFVGYPELVGPTIGVRTLDAACPGETSTSFLAGVRSNGCADPVDRGQAYRKLFPLHVPYRGTQLDYALSTLKNNHGIRLVTLMLGTNDVLRCQQTTADRCARELPDVLANLTTNLDWILGQLRAVYSGKLVLVTYYALNYTRDDPALLATEELNRAITLAAFHVPDVVVADGYGAFRQRALAAGGSSTAAGLVLPDDVHPTLLGQFLLARAVERTVGY